MKAGKRIAELERAPEAADLLAVWARDPYPSQTIAICDWLAGKGAAPFASIAVDHAQVAEFGSRAAQLHSSRPAVLVALGRMFLAWKDLSRSLTTLVRAATISPRDGATYRLLGEVLFRRGDGRRAVWVLERAITLGHDDADTRDWLDVARAYNDDSIPRSKTG